MSSMGRFRNNLRFLFRARVTTMVASACAVDTSSLGKRGGRWRWGGGGGG